mgnify:FL=1|jgi:hypothetical protein
MLPGREQFHQPVAAVFTVQREGQPYQHGSCRNPETDADSLADACHIHDDEHHKYGKQAGSEDKQVLRPESLELHLTAHTLIYFKISHKLLLFLIF